MIKHIGIFLISFSLLHASFAETPNGNPTEPGKPVSLSETFDNPGNLTDAEAEKARTFSHEGYRERKKNEACAANEVNCAAGSDKPTGLGGILVENMGKAYVMIFGGLSFMSGGGGPTLSRGDKIGADGKPVLAEDGKPKEDKQTDYCMYIAMGWEAAMLLAQSSMQGDVEKEVANIHDIQLKALVTLKKNHEARSKTATMQSVAYGVVTTCYAGTALATAARGDVMLYLKGVAAAALMTGYIIIANGHAEAADAVQAVIDSLPKAGDCNPYTGATCFCKEPTSPTMYPGEYQHACVAKLKPTDIADGMMGCASVDKKNNKMTFDKQCKCKATNTCFMTPIKSFTPNFNVGGNLLKTANEGADLLASGNFENAKLTAFTDSARALGAKSFKLSKAKVPNFKLTSDQAKVAAELSKHFPADFARVAAASPSGNGPGLGRGKVAGLDKLPKDLKKKIAEAIKGNYAAGSGNEEGDSEDKPGFVMPTLGDKEADENGEEVLSFAEKAMDGADVNNSPDTPIFDIISNRYRRSWNKVESTEMKQ
ncbi:MAG TPA: hypothetical protein VNJ08_17125 [Bacteriovoracaceae bacterium]|nr:hypothetical protein [Bacteriovoracaceae bacterium]